MTARVLPTCCDDARTSDLITRDITGRWLMFAHVADEWARAHGEERENDRDGNACPVHVEARFCPFCGARLGTETLAPSLASLRSDAATAMRAAAIRERDYLADGIARGDAAALRRAIYVATADDVQAPLAALCRLYAAAHGAEVTP